MKYIKCDRGDYKADIGGPYGVPEAIVPHCMLWHQLGHKGHKVSIIEEGSDK